MGKKYIITESQEKLMLQLVEAELGPEESVLVAKKNPYKYEEFKDARRRYLPSLKDGERFFEFDKELNEEFGENKIVDFYKTLLLNKTVRGNDDKTYTIKDIKANYYPTDLEYAYPTVTRPPRYYFHLYLNFDDIGELGACATVGFDKPAANCEIIKLTGSLAKLNVQEPYKEQIYVSDKLLQFLDENQPKFSRADYPDEGFEIRQIQKQNTDF